MQVARRIHALLIFVALTFGASGTQAAVILNVDSVSGQLLGAEKVDVNGTLFDVEFLDGLCVDLIKGCDGTDSFVFQTFEEAEAAKREGRTSELTMLMRRLRIYRFLRRVEAPAKQMRPCAHCFAHFVVEGDARWCQRSASGLWGRELQPAGLCLHAGAGMKHHVSQAQAPSRFFVFSFSGGTFAKLASF